MFWFLIGQLIVPLFLGIWNMNDITGRLWTLGAAGQLVVSLAVCPLLSAILCIRWMQFLRPMRMFAPSGESATFQVTYGMVAGGLAILISLFSVALLDHALPDYAITSLSTSIACVIVLRATRPIRPGLCIRCEYDLRRSLDYGRCPECGLMV